MSNEIMSISRFLSQYTGEWNPSESLWFGLDFRFNGRQYRFHTGTMYEPIPTILPDGREACFGIYEKVGNEYKLINEYATSEEALNQCILDGKLFRDVLLDPTTELLGQD